jgi:uncharacterized protein
MLRTSSYTIYVDLPGTQDEVLLVHGYTGAYDKVSRPVADFLRSREAKHAAKPLYGDWSPAPGASDGHHAAPAAPSDATLDVLREQGYLTALSCVEEEDFFARLATGLHERALRQSPSYIFMPSYDCNLRCSYCYQDHMRTDCSFHHLLRTMRPAMIDRIFSALPRIEERHGLTGARRRNIGLFGGEPLLAAHRPVIEHLLEKAFETVPETALWAVTNGTEIEAYRDLLGPAGIARLQITLDGPPDKHDRKRVYADGGGSYERIAANITMALEVGTAVSIRLNIDRANLADLPAVAREIAARGWDRHPGFSAYTSPIRPGNGKTDRASTLSSWELDRALHEMREEHAELRVIGRPDEGLKAKARRIFDTRGEILPSLRPSFCSAHDLKSASAASPQRETSSSPPIRSKPGAPAPSPATPSAAAAAMPCTAAAAAPSSPSSSTEKCIRITATASPPASAPTSRKPFWSMPPASRRTPSKHASVISKERPMKKTGGYGEILRLNSAAFVLPPSTGRDGGDQMMEMILSRVLGNGSETTAACTEFTCNLYAPAPPPQAY